MYHTDAQTWLLIHQTRSTELEAEATSRSRRRMRRRVESTPARKQRSREVLTPAPNV